MSDSTTVQQAGRGRLRIQVDPGAHCAEQTQGRELAPAIEAILVTAGRAVSPRRLAIAVGLEKADPEEGGAGTPPAESATPAPRRAPKQKQGPPSAEIIKGAIDELNRQYEASSRSFRVEAVAGGYRLMTLAEFSGPVRAFHGAAASQRLSKAAVETLAIVAYKQPLTRAHVEAIRGVACGDILKTLLDRKLVTIAGRAEELGRPLLYATSRQFLEAFGLASLKDLPTVTELGLRAGTESV